MVWGLGFFEGSVVVWMDVEWEWFLYGLRVWLWGLLIAVCLFVRGGSGLCTV